jgi:HEPN domain-containing protein
MKKEFVVVNARSMFKTPQTMEEAEDRLKALLEEIAQLKSASSQDNCPMHPQTGEPLTTQEHSRWKRETCFLLARKNREVAYLKSWMRLQGSVLFATHTPKPEVAFRILWQCNQLFERLSRQGISFSSEEKRLLEEVQSLTSLREDTLIEEARACANDTPLNTFQFNGYIARATKSEKDLVVLTRAWVKIREEAPTDTLLITKCGQRYVDALCDLNRFEEARAVVESLDQTDPTTPYIWLALARYSGDKAILEHARVLSVKIPEKTRSWFFLRLYSVSGEKTDLNLARKSLQSEQSSSKDLERFAVSTVKALAGWDEIEEARTLYRDLRNLENRLYALACIAETSGESSELRELLSLLKRYTPQKLATLQLVTAVLAQYGYDREIREMIDSLNPWHLRCASYSILARFVTQDDATNLLEKAERMLTSAHFIGDTAEGQTLYNLVYAQAMNGRRANALAATRLINDRLFRCMAILLIYASSKEGDLPDFLEEAL